MGSKPPKSRQHQARWWATHYRRKFYAGKLDKHIPVEVGAGNLHCNHWGETYFEDGEPVLIRIAEACWTKAGTEKDSFMKSTLLHELVHSYLGPGVDHDSPEWNAEVLRLSKLGALLETI